MVDVVTGKYLILGQGLTVTRFRIAQHRGFQVIDYFLECARYCVLFLKYSPPLFGGCTCLVETSKKY